MMDSFVTMSQMYLAALATLLDDPDFRCSPRKMGCSEMMNWPLVVEQPDDCAIITRSPERNEVMKDYLEVERSLYLSGELRVDEWVRRASKFWAGVANPDGTINSNYGWLALVDRSLPDSLTPWEWARESLLSDRDSRQAFVRFSQPRHQWRGNRDQVCTMHLMFMVRGDRLHATAVMRSCDVVKGLAYDAPWFCHLLLRMAAEVEERVGTYTHLAHSLHLYDRDRAVAELMLGRR